ncbi:hypothetical protein DLM45_11760 [Hyphomicrobium methylovorum]|uniref:hypothetical protein n=1 Tax=Hyphomicrobium methylovorum TaxID=84 RepID=UPI0015E6C0A0|nr:hypothetical protein [Hyphomicrobium methylovorum]MBA2126889.1 hypothetical protein [Hyphomicrobium methylovorum]
MSGIVVGTASAIVALGTVLIATIPDAHALMAPLVEPGNEYALVSVSILASLPVLSVLSVLALSGRE